MNYEQTPQFRKWRNIARAVTVLLVLMVSACLWYAIAARDAPNEGYILSEGGEIVDAAGVSPIPLGYGFATAFTAAAWIAVDLKRARVHNEFKKDN